MLIHDECSTRNSTNSSCNTFKYGITLTGLRSNSYYNLWYVNVCNLLITAVIPLVSLTYLNTNVYLKFKEYIQRQPLSKVETSRKHSTDMQQQRIKQREKDMIQQTLILFSVVILFGLFHILRIVLNIEEFASLDDRKDSNEIGCEWLQFWTIIASPVSHLLLQVNSSTNFVIYCYFNKYFRDELLSWINMILTYMRLKSASTDPANSTEHELNTMNVTTTEI